MLLSQAVAGNLYRLLDFVHRCISETLDFGDYAVDATAGNGHDTVRLADAVGTRGRVWAFDVQRAALDATRQRLAANDLTDRVDLVERGHEEMASVLPDTAAGRVRAVTFNLGYLPGSDKTRVTHPATTCRALDAAVGLLAAGGVVTVVCYTGHPGGAAEATAVRAWAEALPQASFRVLSYQFINRQNDPPRLLVVQRRDSGTDR